MCALRAHSGSPSTLPHIPHPLTGLPCGLARPVGWTSDWTGLAGWLAKPARWAGSELKPGAGWGQ